MNFEQLLNLLGKTTKTREWKEFFNSVDDGVEGDAKLGVQSFKNDGLIITFQIPRPIVDSIVLYISGLSNKEDEYYFGFKPYSGKLPQGVTRTDNRAQAQAKLGKPIDSGSWKVPSKKPTDDFSTYKTDCSLQWDLYVINDFECRFSYGEFDELCLIELFSP